ncbi:MAG: FAD-dependent oxidoreductase [Bdellovibrionota bacterium]
MDLNILIVGGGIHGIGLMHDLASRQIPGVHLVEKKFLASGTSSRSTKLFHGGLRYLEHFNQWGLVREALHERTLFLKLLKGLVHPMPFVLPHFKNSARPAFLVRSGLFFYDLLSGDGGLPPAQSIQKENILTYAPYLNEHKVKHEIQSAFLYYDAQMLDDVIARLAAHASLKLGATFEEQSEVTAIQKTDEGFKVTIQNASGVKTLSTKYVVNAGGAWSNANLLKWGYVPKVTCLLNLGTHLVFKPEVSPQSQVNNCSATLIQEPDGRVVFFIPWQGKWLLGTTESILSSDPSQLHYPEEDKRYLMNVAQTYLNLTNAEENIDEIFCGVRCMPLDKRLPIKNTWHDAWATDPYSSPFYVRHLDKNISGLSRETVIEENADGIYSIYGGKWTTYRSVSEELGTKLSRKLRLGRRSGTHLPENWFLQQLMEEKPEIFVSSKELRRDLNLKNTF